MNKQVFVKPRLQVLNPDQLKEVHRYSIRVLEDTGIQVESKNALRVFEKSGVVKISNDMVFIQEYLVNHAISQAPSNIEVYNQSGNPAFHLGKKQG